jgi:hypothetical protein
MAKGATSRLAVLGTVIMAEVLNSRDVRVPDYVQWKDTFSVGKDSGFAPSKRICKGNLPLSLARRAGCASDLQVRRGR